MRIKCPHCKGKGFSELNSALNMTCGWCMGQGELDLEIVPTKPQTEQEYLQTCTTEQLAEFFIKAMLFYDNAGITLLEAIKNAVEDNENLSKHFIENVVEWLKQPHKPKE